MLYLYHSLQWLVPFDPEQADPDQQGCLHYGCLLPLASSCSAGDAIYAPGAGI
jgi:hypothetical protein